MKTNHCIARTHYRSPLGPMILAASADGLAGVWFDQQRHLPDTTMLPEEPANALMDRAARQLDEYFAGHRQRFDVALDLSAGTEFQQAVWQALLGIEPGQATSYGALATAMGKPRAVRALGAAVGRNPVSIIVPCHRVLGLDGSLTGYAGGLDRKRHLLQLEGVL